MGSDCLCIIFLFCFLLSSTYPSLIKQLLLLLPLLFVLIHKFLFIYPSFPLPLFPWRVGEMSKQLCGVCLPVWVSTQQENKAFFQEMGAKIQPCSHPHWLQIGVFAGRLWHLCKIMIIRLWAMQILLLSLSSVVPWDQSFRFFPM